MTVTLRKGSTEVMLQCIRIDVQTNFDILRVGVNLLPILEDQVLLVNKLFSSLLLSIYSCRAAIQAKPCRTQYKTIYL